MSESNTTKLINQLWFEIHGGDKIKAASKAIEDEFKQIKKDADLANESMDKVIKNWSSLARMPKAMSNISPVIYNKQQKKTYMNWARNTHAVENTYSDQGIFNMSAARETWKLVESEKKKQQKIEERITREVAETLRKIQARNLYETAINAQIQKTKAAEEKIRRMTEYQNAKIGVAKEKNRNYAARTGVMADQLEESIRMHNQTSNWRAYREKHPELFAAGGLSHNVRYQTARMFSGLGGTVSSMGMGGKLLGGLLDSIGNLVKSPVAGFAASLINFSKAIKEVGTAAVQAYSEIESIKTQLGVVFSNQTQADAMFGNIAQYAVKSPFGVQQTSELAVLLKQSGVYASDLMNTLRMLGDTAGGNMEKMKRIANNYAQIVSIGKASMLDMRQFAYAGIPIFEAVSKELKVSQQELRKMISDGKVTSDIIEKVFKDLTGINGIFEKATEKGAKTLKARLQNLKDAQQLAMGTIGENVVNFGTTNGGDSIANNIVTITENIWQWIKEHVDTVNIENDVNTIAQRETRIERLSELMSTYGDNKIMSTLINKAYEVQIGKRNADTERNIYNKSYENKMKGRNEALERYGITSIAEAREFADTIKYLTNSFNRFNYDLTNETKYAKKYNQGWVRTDRVAEVQASARKFGIDLGFITSTSADESRAIVESVNRLVEALNDSNKLTAEEIKAHRESMLLDAQQLAYDQTSKTASATNSLNTSFEELYSIYKDSDEYKEKTEKERLKRLEEAKIILNKIAENTDEKGNVNVSKYKGNVKELYNLLQQGAFTPGKKLDVVTGNSQADHQNRILLLDQLDVLSSSIREDFKYSLDNSDALKAFSEVTMDKLRNRLSDTAFYENFSNYYKEMQLSLEELEKSSPDKNLQQNIQMYKALLPVLLSTLNAETEGRFANLDEKNKSGTSYEFIPLWKRILAQGTGLTAQGMTSTKQTMENYQNDMAIRNMAAGVLSATFKSVGLGSAMGLMRSNELKQLRGDASATYQINWQETKKAMHDFATQLSASTDVIAAYKKGLEDELNVYQELVTAGYTQAESQDIKNQKLVNTKTIAKLAMDAGDQLVNAFGEEFVTASGQKAYLHDDGQFYDAIEGGNKIQEEELRLTGNLFRMVEQRLGQLYSEIHEANAAELNNAALGKMLSDVAPTAYMSTIMKAGTSAGNLRFLASNQEYISKFIDTKINDLKTNDSRFKLLDKVSNDDIIMKALNGDTYVEELIKQWSILENKIMSSNDTDERKQLTAEQDVIVSKIGEANDEMKLLIEVFKSLDQNVSDLTGDEKFTLLYERLKGIKKEGALNTAVSNLLGAYSIENTPKYLQNIPENYEGGRGTRNWLLKALGWNTDSFDKEDLYVAAAKGGYFKNDPYYQTANGTNFFEGLSDETIINLLGDADKKAIDLAYSFERIAQAIDDMNTGLAQSLRDFTKDSFLAPFEQLGDYLVTDNDLAEGLKDKMKSLGAELVSQMGTYMARAGFSLVAMGAETANIGLVTGGLALAAAGGFASGLGGALKQTDNKDKNDKEIQRLENLKSDLQKLLEQARTDALYYENNLRHKTALGINKDFSYKSVHDAVITKKGDVITTDPRDYLFATKNPQQLLGGGNVTVTPVINCNVVNNTNSRVRQEQVQNADGSIDILTIIDEAVGDYIASSRSDDAFSAREYRIKGRQAIM